MSQINDLRDWDSFKHKSFFANPEPEPMFSFSDDDPPVHLPPDLRIQEAEPDITADRPWHTTLPSSDGWEKIWDLVQNYIGGVTIAILDTGANPHQYLKKPERMISHIPGQSAFDGHGHGTHCSGIATGLGRRFGVAPGANLYIGKVLSNQGGGASSGIEEGVKEAIDWKGDNGFEVDVINMSLGGSQRHAGTIQQIMRAFSKGVQVGCAAGNEGPRLNTEGWPAKEPGVPSIASMNQAGNVSNYSSRGDILVACPGEQITSADNRSQTGERIMSGTSMASPFFCGVQGNLIALRRASGFPRWRDNTPVFNLMKAYAIDQGQPGYDPHSGHGVIDMLSLLRDVGRRGADIFSTV